MSFRLTRNKRSAIAPVAGERQFSKLVNGVQGHYVDVVARATVTVTVANATAVLNRGSVWSLFDEIGIEENGTDRMIMHGRVLRFLSEMAAPSSLSATRMTSPNIAVYNLVESARIYFAHPFAANPRETAFREHDVRQDLRIFAKMASNPAAALLTVGGATVVVSAVSVSATHGYDKDERDLPYFIPRIYQQVVQVAGTNAQLPEYIRSNNAIRALVVSQETTTVGEVSDILNAVALKSDTRDIIGPNPVRLDELQYASEFDFGGAVVSSNKAHLGLNFQQWGRLAYLLAPGQDVNLRFEFDVQASASAGTSQLRITRVELDPDPTLCKKLDIPL